MRNEPRWRVWVMSEIHAHWPHVRIRSRRFLYEPVRASLCRPAPREQRETPGARRRRHLNGRIP